MRMDNRNRNMGGIEGLPLQLMIIMMVAAMGTGILVGWMGTIETPHSIGDIVVEPNDSIVVDDDGRTLPGFTVVVTDQDGNYLDDATVVLEGLNVTDDGKTPYSVTGPDGRATFDGLTINPYGSSPVGFIDVIVTKTGYTNEGEVRITVIL